MPATSSLNPKIKIQYEARFQILRLVHDNPRLSQRELRERLGISLGAVNYCLKALIDRGLVKAQNFKKNPDKTGYSYFLTPAGISEKTRLTAQFLTRKKQEYDALDKEIRELSLELNLAQAGLAELEGEPE